MMFQCSWSFNNCQKPPFFAFFGVITSILLYLWMHKIHLADKLFFTECQNNTQVLGWLVSCPYVKNTNKVCDNQKYFDYQSHLQKNKNNNTTTP